MKRISHLYFQMISLTVSFLIALFAFMAIINGLLHESDYEFIIPIIILLISTILFTINYLKPGLLNRTFKLILTVVFQLKQTIFRIFRMLYA